MIKGYVIANQSHGGLNIKFKRVYTDRLEAERDCLNFNKYEAECIINKLDKDYYKSLIKRLELSIIKNTIAVYMECSHRSCWGRFCSVEQIEIV